MVIAPYVNMCGSETRAMLCRRKTILFDKNIFQILISQSSHLAVFFLHFLLSRVERLKFTHLWSSVKLRNCLGNYPLSLNDESIAKKMRVCACVSVCGWV